MILNNDRRTTTPLVGARAVKRFNIDPGNGGGKTDRLDGDFSVPVEERKGEREGKRECISDFHEFSRNSTSFIF